MRLLILAPEYDGSGGGIMTFYQALLPALQTEGVDVRVIEGSAFHAAEDKSPRSHNGVRVETLELNRVRRWLAKFSHLAALPGLRRHLAAAWAMWEQAGFGEDADIVEACDWGLLFVPPALDRTRPVLVQCHGSVAQIAQHDPIAGEESQSALIRLLERGILAGVDALQTCSSGNATYWQGETGRDCSVHYPAWTRPATPPQTLTNGGSVVGRLQRWKGPQVVCAALDLLREGTVQIDWVGRDTPWGYRNGSTAAHLAKTYSRVWGKTIVHHGPRSAEEVRCRQSAALFNLVPSTWDVFNFTVVEAMASGRPTIVSTGAGASELIEDGVNGFTFPAGDAEKLAATIDRVLGSSPGSLAEVGRAAQCTIQRALDPATIAAQRLIAYRSKVEGFREHRKPCTHASLEEICRPTDASARDDGAFLDQLPLRLLMRHLVGRVAKKAALSSLVERQHSRTRPRPITC
jgi:glycosyltransferase involved in cell wall biosynthesis